MLKIRLTRRGKKNSAFFRVVVAEHTAPIKGKFIEVLGFLNPHTKEKNLKEDRIKYWIENGAQCSDSVHNLLVANGIVKGPKRTVKLKKKPVEEAKEVEKSEEGGAKAEPTPSADKKPEENEPMEASIEASTETSKEEKVEDKKDNAKAASEEAKEEKPAE